MKLPIQDLEKIATELLIRAGVPEDSAEIVTQVLLFADKRGIETHGISKLPIYIKRIEDGGLDPKAFPEVIFQKGAICQVDGHNALGPVAGVVGMDQAIQAASLQGVGITLVRNSNHFGATAFYSMRALKRNMIGFAFSNANPTVAPWGGKQAMVGTSPLSVAIPTKSGLPFVLDMASTTVARGKIILYARDKKPLPSGWALDSEGRETTDPEVALKGLLTPLGGAKGSGLALVIDILCGLLSGSKYLTEVGHLYTGTDKPQGIGHLFAALDIEPFMPLDSFLSAMDQYIEKIHACPTASGVERIYVSGEIEYLNSLRAEKEGVEVSEATWKDLQEVAVRYGLNLENFFTLY